jgi:hypothetical protein
VSVPAWLANVEVELTLSGYDYEQQLGLLDWMAERVNAWLDRTRIHGHREARRLWARICRCYLSVAYFVALRGHDNGALTRIVDTCVRLNGLRLTPEPKLRVV